MKPRILIAIIFVALAVLHAKPQQAVQPLTKNQVMDLVKFGMDSAELVQKIKDFGIDFEPTKEYLDSLRKAGAQEPVIEALREKPRPLTKEQVGKLVVGGVPSERAAALVKQRGIDFEADRGYLETLRVAGADDTLLESIRTASSAAASAMEEGKLKEIRNASAQLSVWLNMKAMELNEKALAGNQRADALADKIVGNEKRFEQWQQSEWAPDLTDQKRGIFITMGDDGRASFCCLPESNRLYSVEAPPQIRWLILMEKMRWTIGGMVEIDEFNHVTTTDDDFLTPYRGVWQGARDYFCKYSPGAKFTDLNGQEQVCPQPQISRGR